MQELIKIHEKDQKQVFSARELYDFLELSQSQWKRWYEKNITKNPFAIETLDFGVFDTMSKTKEGRPTEDFWITMDFAKRLSMLVRNEKGEEIRRYFIWCENKLSDIKRQKDDLELLTIEQVYYMIDLVNCFKFLAHQEAVELSHRDKFIEASKNKDSTKTMQKIMIEFHNARNQALNISKEELQNRLLRYYQEGNPYKGSKENKREILLFIDKYGLIENAVFDFLKAGNKATDKAVKISSMTKEIAKRLNIELRRVNKPDLLHEEIESLNLNILRPITPYLKDTEKKQLKKGA